MNKPISSIFSLLILSFLYFPNLHADPKKLEKPLTSGFNHVGLSVTHLDKSTSFFVDTLGWRLTGGDKDYPANFVTDGKIFLTLWQIKSPATAIKFNRKNNVGLHHLAISVPDFKTLDRIYERVKKVDGVVIEFAPELAYGGPTKHMMLREPSGNRLEFAHNPPRKKNKVKNN
ncbi:VOC family protein [Aliikangiella coralliicola]|uniref:VOC family protein n=1 Tax=Aliikangiella coralliicola TaxID=2592383 RepID=A0A545UCP6_9GAMM|nr:VOC family protein [Aliikangiella coralliicola]TQV87244.1 VOC family protein [Aliikangiella coralliicola]